jgi:hypothetical protein
MPEPKLTTHLPPSKLPFSEQLALPAARPLMNECEYATPIPMTEALVHNFFCGFSELIDAARSFGVDHCRAASFHLLRSELRLDADTELPIFVSALPLAIVRLWPQGQLSQIEWSFLDDELISQLPDDAIRKQIDVRLKVLSHNITDLDVPRIRSLVANGLPPGVEHAALIANLLRDDFFVVSVNDQTRQLGEFIWFLVPRAEIATAPLAEQRAAEPLLRLYQTLWRDYGSCAEILGEHLPSALQSLAQQNELQYSFEQHPKIGDCCLMRNPQMPDRVLVFPIPEVSRAVPKDLHCYWLQHI